MLPQLKNKFKKEKKSNAALCRGTEDDIVCLTGTKVTESKSDLQR